MNNKTYCLIGSIGLSTDISEICSLVYLDYGQSVLKNYTNAGEYFDHMYWNYFYCINVLLEYYS